MGLSASNPNIKRGILHTQIFWQLTRQSLPMRLTPWRWTAGSTPQSPCLGYITIQSIRRLYTHRSNSEAQQGPSGLHTSQPYLQITMFHGVSSVLPSAHTTYPRLCSTPSGRSSTPCIRLHEAVQHSCSVRIISHRHG
jgi:hypothetical protein